MSGRRLFPQLPIFSSSVDSHVQLNELDSSSESKQPTVAGSSVNLVQSQFDQLFHHAKQIEDLLTEQNKEIAILRQANSVLMDEVDQLKKSEAEQTRMHQNQLERLKRSAYENLKAANKTIDMLNAELNLVTVDLRDTQEHSNLNYHRLKDVGHEYSTLERKIREERYSFESELCRQKNELLRWIRAYEVKADALDAEEEYTAVLEETNKDLKRKLEQKEKDTVEENPTRSTALKASEINPEPSVNARFSGKWEPLCYTYSVPFLLPSKYSSWKDSTLSLSLDDQIFRSSRFSGNVEFGIESVELGVHSRTITGSRQFTIGGEFGIYTSEKMFNKDGEVVNYMIQRVVENDVLTIRIESGDGYGTFTFKKIE